MFQDREKISDYQALMLILAAGIGNIFVVIAAPAIKNAGRDGWISVLLAYGIATVIGLALVKLKSRFPNKTIIQYMPKIWGRVLGKLLSLFYILSFWSMTGLIYRENAEVMAFFLEETPSISVNIIMSILVIYVMKKGFKIFARTAELLVPIIIIFIILSVCMLIPDVKFERLAPVLDNGFLPLLKALLIQVPYAMETILFMAIWFPCLNKKKEGTRAILIGVPVAGILMTIIVVVTIAFMGTTLPVKVIFPPFYMSRYILFAQFLTGLDAIFMLLWIASSYLQICIFFYPGVIGLAQWLNLKDYKPLIIPMTIIAIILSMVPANVIELLKLDTLKNPYLILPMALMIPLSLVIALIRKLDES